MSAIGIDFGTSNTAAGLVRNGAPVVLPLDQGEATLPTAVFLDYASGRMCFGRAATDAMTEGRDGRFMRALKSVLGTPLAREKRQFLNQRLSLIDIIARFLAEVRDRAEAATGDRFDRAISGRPVRFHSASGTRDAQALADLEQAYGLAGFNTVSFVPEPEAAALVAGVEGRVLVVDIGGGTSDFTLCDRRGEETRILASRGIRLGGTDFDRMLSLSHAMPLFGYMAQIGKEMGPGTHPAPRAPFHDLATWEKIAFVYGAALLRDVRRWKRLASEPVLFSRLETVLDMHLGHDIAHAVEAGKIAANEGSGRIDLGVVEPGLSVALDARVLPGLLTGAAQTIAECAVETIAQAGCTPDSVDWVVYVGGSSRLDAVRTAIEACCPGAGTRDSEVFTAVAGGLALTAGQAHRHAEG